MSETGGSEGGRDYKKIADVLETKAEGWLVGVCYGQLSLQRR